MNTPLHIACHMKALKIIRLLLERKCSTNFPNKKAESAEEIPLNEDGNCLLLIACQWGDVDIIKYLITDQRCNPYITNTSKLTPLHTASKHGHLDVVKVLVSRKNVTEELHCTQPASMVTTLQFNSLFLIRDVSYVPRIERVKLLFILLLNMAIWILSCFS